MKLCIYIYVLPREGLCVVRLGLKEKEKKIKREREERREGELGRARERLKERLTG